MHADARRFGAGFQGSVEVSDYMGDGVREKFRAVNLGEEC